MRTIVLSLMALVFICPAALSAQEITDADRAAVAAYTEATARLGAQMREARKEIREKNTELAEILARDAAKYKEEDVIAAHKALTGAYAKMTEVELANLLLYKTYHPEWKPEADGRRVTPPNERREGRDEEAAPKEAQAK